MMMIYSSDFSFAARAIVEVWIWLWFIQRVWITDNFSSLQWSKVRKFDLKSIITLLILIMLPAQAVFDVIWTYLKYSEGFIVDQVTNKIFAKPAYDMNGNTKIQLWTEGHILLKTATEYVLACGFAFQIGTLALMQAFWSHLSSQMGGKPFMRSWKFRFYVSWVFASMVIFPLARFLSGHDDILTENVPQFIFGFQLLFISLLGIKNGTRLNDLLESIQQPTSPRGQETILRIHYFLEMNKLLSFGAFLISVGLSSIAIDAIFRLHHISQSKFLVDFLIIHANFGSLILWVTMILIIYPRYQLSDVTAKDNVSSEFEQIRLKNPTNSHVIDLHVPTAAASPSMSSTRRPKTVRESISYKVGKSVSNILEQQAKQIEIFRHKNSTSISSTITSLSNHVPTSPLIPPVTKHENEISR